MPVKNVTYTEEEKQKVLNFWNSRKSSPPSLSEIVSHLSDGESDEPRSNPWGYKARQILIDAQLKPQTKKWEKVDGIELTEEQQLFIKNNIQDNRPIDLARTLFPNAKISPLGREVRAINNYLKSIGEEVVRRGEETPIDDKYEPPKTIHQILAKVNIYLNIGLSLQNMTAYQKRCLENTINFLHSPRFIQEINNYASVEKRNSLESEFIRGVFDKPDLMPEEVSLYINWCNDIIQASDLKKQLDKLNVMLDTITDDPQGKSSMALAETIGKVTGHLNEVLKRQERIYAILNTARSKRVEDKESKQANMAQLYEWFREEENRKKMLKQADLLKEGRENEKKRLENLNDVIFLSLGLGDSGI